MILLNAGPDWAQVAASTRAWASEPLPGVDTRATVDVVAEHQRTGVT